MPPKKTPKAAAEPTQRRSKLAKEHDISAADENDIREAFALFAQPMKGEKEGVLMIKDVKNTLTALDISKSAEELTEILEILDPDPSTGYTTFANFLAIAALSINTKSLNNSEDAAKNARDEAFELFTQGRGEVITMEMLRRVARELKEDVPDEVLRDMVLEGNGGKGVNRGVGREEFEMVTRRAGVRY